MLDFCSVLEFYCVDLGHEEGGVRLVHRVPLPPEGSGGLTFGRFKFLYLLKRYSFIIWICRFSRVLIVILMSSPYPCSSYDM